MTRLLLLFILFLARSSENNTPAQNSYSRETTIAVLIRNDTDKSASVITSGSAAVVRLEIKSTVTIKMKPGEQLFAYNNKKKGELLLTASKEMDGKIQLLSKL